jgi:predicted Zn-dependent protease with MMP-like domain
MSESQDANALLDPVWAAYRTNQLDTALTLAKALTQSHPDRGGVWFAYGCVLERRGDHLAADRTFSRAARCKEDPVGRPYRCNWPAFRRIVDQHLSALPAAIRSAIDEVTLVLADYADPELLDDGKEPELLGLFLGPVRAERDQGMEISPRIHVYRRAHEHCCATATEFRQELRTTLLHEFGHYLGYDEEDLERLGME